VLNGKLILYGRYGGKSWGQEEDNHVLAGKPEWVLSLNGWYRAYSTGTDGRVAGTRVVNERR